MASEPIHETDLGTSNERVGTNNFLEDGDYHRHFDHGLSQEGTIMLSPTKSSLLGLSRSIRDRAARHASTLAGPALELKRTPTWQRLVDERTKNNVS
jgi:hypothetical protein